MDYAKIQSLIKKYGYDETFSQLLKKISEIDFPVYAPVSSDEEALRMIKRIDKEYKPTFENVQYKQVMQRKTNLIDFKFRNKYISMFSANFEEFDLFIAYFSGRCNMHARRYEMPGTPYEIWKNPEHRKRVLQFILKNKMGITLQSLDNANYTLAKACTYFRVTLMLNLIIIFQPKSILDLCAGWGERLLGSIIKKVNYTGIDPSECMESVYKRIIKLTKTEDTAIVHKIGSENLDDVLKPTDKYDMVLFPPPYFDLEIYNNDPTQSINVYPDFDTWVERYLFVSIKLAWNHLVEGGHLIMYIGDYKNINGEYAYTERTVLYACGFLDDCKYEGSIGRTSDRRKYYSFFCLKKDSSVSSEDKKHYKDLYIKNYGNIKNPI